MVRDLLVVGLVLAASGAAMGQFSNTPITDSGFAMLLGGPLVRGDGAPPIEAGDQIGVFFGTRLVGATTLTSGQASGSMYANLRVFGDNPNTADVEGPALGEVITFRYYDASTNTTLTNVRALNSGGEPVNYAWQGGEDVPIPLPIPIPIIPSDTVSLRVSEGTDGGGDGGGGGGGETGNPDVNGDGRVTREDAAMVLRVVIGGGRGLDEATIGRADVDGSGTVTTEDAIAVLRARQG